MVPKCVLLSTFPTPVRFVQTHPLVLLQVFLHSGNLLFIPTRTEAVCLYFTVCSRPPPTSSYYFFFFPVLHTDEQSPLSAPSCKIARFFGSALSQPCQMFGGVSVFFVKCPCSYREFPVCSRRIALPFISYPPCYELGGTLCHWSTENKHTDNRRDPSEKKAAAHLEVFWDTLLMWKSSLKF